jgi:hypothetical protein
MESILTLRLFNSVIIDNTEPDYEKFRNTAINTIPNGYVIDPIAVNYSELPELITQCNELFVDGSKANSSFHKSWKKIKETSHNLLAVEQVIHYITTYGFKALGIFSEQTIYIPEEELNIPEPTENMPITVINGITSLQAQTKCIELLNSGAALDSDAIDDIINILYELNALYSNINQIQNKEAKLQALALLDITPTEEPPAEFLRYLIYRSTGSTLLIKDEETISSIKLSNYSIAQDCRAYGLAKLSSIFYRFKPIFLAFKNSDPESGRVINRIRKLATKYHKPTPTNYLNNITSLSNNTVDKDEIRKELDNTTNFRKIRILYAIQVRLADPNYLLYRIRNGKSFVKEAPQINNTQALAKAYRIIYEHLVESIRPNIQGTKVKFANREDAHTQITYPLVSSAKKFIGNFPEGTMIESKHPLIIGIYWQNDYGARDLDLSALIPGKQKIGWNSSYKMNDEQIMFSGDITDAPNGASELIRVNGTNDPILVMSNVFSGMPNARFKPFVAVDKEAASINRGYTVDPNNIIAEADTKMSNADSTMGLITQKDNNTLKYIMSNFAMGSSAISFSGSNTSAITEYFIDQYSTPITLDQLLSDAGAESVEQEKEADINLLPQSIQKDTIINLLQ